MASQLASLPVPHRQSMLPNCLPSRRLPTWAHKPTMPSYEPTECDPNHTYSDQQPLMQLPKPIPQQPTLSLRHRSLSPQLVQNGPWTSEEDETLCDYRSRGFGWAQIQEKHFPGKSANACRKRYERLMAKRRSTDWDESRLERLAVEYRKMREGIWGPLADKLGEKWEHVEKAVRKDVDILSLTANCSQCVQQDLKGLQNRAANHCDNQWTVSSSFKIGNFSGSNNENGYFLSYSPEVMSSSSGEAARAKPFYSSPEETLNTNREKTKENLDPSTSPDIWHPFRKAIEASSEPSDPRTMSTLSQHALHRISVEDTGIEKQRDQSTLPRDLGTTGHCKPYFPFRCNISTNIY